MTESNPSLHDLPGSSVGALVVGGDFHGLAIARSLGRKGIPVCIIDNEISIGRFSRYATHFRKVSDLRGERETINSVLQVAKELNLKGWILFPTRDEHVAAFSRHKAELEEWFRVPTPGWETIKWAWNKWNTYRLAEKLGIDIPKTWCPRSLAELEAIETDFPLGVKPAVKEDFFYATKAKAWRANNREELKSLWEQAVVHSGSNEVLIQEIVPGDGTCQFSSCMFFKDGKPVASMEAQRWRQHPPEFGRAATYVESIDRPDLTELSARFLREVNYYGLAEVEFKLDPRDGKYKLLDVNARTWGFHVLCPAAGIDFPYLLFLDQTGKEVVPCRGRPGVGWIRMVTDIPSCVLGFAGGYIHWADYRRSLNRFAVESVFSKEDLLPTIAELIMLPYLAVKKGF
jgi:predicted ATP-grasp superfamily ATP-dependent carboligase